MHGAHTSQEGIGFLGVTGGCERSCGCWESNPAPLSASILKL